MAKLKLWYPIEIRPWTIGQAFGECAPAVCSKYKEMGLLGHNGQDIPCPTGTPVYAAHDGVVTFSGEDGSAGYGIVIRTNTAFEYGEGECYFKTIYWHLLPSGLKVQAGQSVRAGDLISLADNTGFSTGSHLHFGLKPVYKGERDWEWFNAEQNNGYLGAIDPTPYYNDFYAKDRELVTGLFTKLAELYIRMVVELTKRVTNKII